MTKTKKKIKFPKKTITAIVVLGALVAGYFALQKEEIQVTLELRQSTATIGTIMQTLDSSGTIEAYEEYTVTALVKGDIIEDNVEVSSIVEKDQLLYHIDSSETENNIIKAENTLTKQRTSYQQTIDSLENLNIKTNMTGTVMEVYVSVGSNVTNQTTIAKITDLSTLQITLPFHKANSDDITVGSMANVLVEEAGEMLMGTVTGVSNSEYISNTGALVREVQIEVKNPGVLTENYTGSATINGATSADTSNFSYKYSSTITAGTSGEISKLNIMNGDAVTKNQVIAVAYDEDMDTTIENAKLTLEDSILTYETTLDTLNDYKITSPITGTIMQKNYKAGDTLSSSNSSLAVVADMSKVKFQMSVDELNVSNLSMDAEVIVTADAIDYRTYMGRIESIGLIGSQSSGVTTYPIIVVIDDPEGLLPGMNVTADIVIKQEQNVVTIPSSYVARGNTVLISESDASNYEKSDSGEPGTISQMASPIDGYVYLCIESGISDGTTVAITNGLKEGTKVYMQSVVATGMNQEDNSNSFSFGGMTSGGMTGTTGGPSSNTGTTTRPGR